MARHDDHDFQRHKFLNGVVFKFTLSRQGCTFSYKGAVLRRDASFNYAGLAELFNHYKALSKAELEELLGNNLEEEKHKLMMEITELENEKSDLTDSLKTFREKLDNLIKEMDS
mgnify:CR=1 FL=1